MPGNHGIHKKMEASKRLADDPSGMLIPMKDEKEGQKWVYAFMTSSFTEPEANIIDPVYAAEEFDANKHGSAKTGALWHMVMALALNRNEMYRYAQRRRPADEDATGCFGIIRTYDSVNLVPCWQDFREQNKGVTALHAVASTDYRLTSRFYLLVYPGEAWLGASNNILNVKSEAPSLKGDLTDAEMLDLFLTLRRKVLNLN